MFCTEISDVWSQCLINFFCQSVITRFSIDQSLDPITHENRNFLFHFTVNLKTFLRTCTFNHRFVITLRKKGKKKLDIERVTRRSGNNASYFMRAKFSERAPMVSCRVVLVAKVSLISRTFFLSLFETPYKYKKKKSIRAAVKRTHIRIQSLLPKIARGPLRFLSRTHAVVWHAEAKKNWGSLGYVRVAFAGENNNRFLSFFFSLPLKLCAVLCG